VIYDGSNNGSIDEQPVHRVKISRNFEMGQYEITQEHGKRSWESFIILIEKMMNANLPVSQLSWDEVQEFISN